MKNKHIIQYNILNNITKYRIKYFFLSHSSSISMDKSWTKLKNRLSNEYWRGTEEFINLATHHLNSDGLTRCPCKKCLNRSWVTTSKAHAHIIDHGFHPNYNVWIYHGEAEVGVHAPSSSATTTGVRDIAEDEMAAILLDLVNEIRNVDEDEDNEGMNPVDPEVDAYASMFDNLHSELYPGCPNMSSFAFLVKLMHLKVLHKWTNRSFDALCDMLKASHPRGNKVPDSHYDAKRKLRAVGLGYESIHVCKYDCALFWKEYADAQSCPVYGESR